MSQPRRPSNQNRPRVSRPGPRGLRFGMFAVCVVRDSDPGLNKGKAKALYQLLVSYSDVTTRSTDQGYPYRSALADCLDCTKDTIDNATKYLEREIGLIRVERRKVEGKPDENDANLYQVYDQWLIQGCEPTPDTPPQLVARYGPTISGFDVDAWITEHAPSFDLAGWRAAYEATLREQEAKRVAQRQKESRRRKARKTGRGSGTDSATPEGDGDEEGSGMYSATGDGTDSATGGGTCAALSRTGLPDSSSPDANDAPSGRSPGGVRSTSTSGSSSAEGASGSAAAAEAGSSSDEEAGKQAVPGQRQPRGPELSREQLSAVRAVEALLPSALLAKLPYQQFPKRNRPAVLDALESRTVEQIRERVERRWLAYGYEPALHDGTLTSPVGAALELVGPTRFCRDLSCEDGTMIDTGADCRACLERRASRRAARAAGQLVNTGSSRRSGGGLMPVCVICEAPFPGTVPDDGECRRCREEAAAASEALRALLEQPVNNSQGHGPAAADSPPEAVQEVPEVDEETARLRAFYARQYGTREQIEAYCTEAPF